jgi:hypothetical protein
MWLWEAADMKRIVNLPAADRNRQRRGAYSLTTHTSQILLFLPACKRSRNCPHIFGKELKGEANVTKRKNKKRDRQ